MVFTYQDKLNLKEDIVTLTKHDWFQIYIILKNNKESFTTNNSGLFFDLINILLILINILILTADGIQFY